MSKRFWEHNKNENENENSPSSSQMQFICLEEGVEVEVGEGEGEKKAGLGPGLGVSLVKWRCTQGDCLIYRQQEIKKNVRERQRERGRKGGRGGGEVEIWTLYPKSELRTCVVERSNQSKGGSLPRGGGMGQWQALGLPNWVATLGRFLSTHHNQRARERKCNGRGMEGMR